MVVHRQARYQPRQAPQLEALQEKFRLLGFVPVRL
jgi:hypothetical protein